MKKIPPSEDKGSNGPTGIGSYSKALVAFRQNGDTPETRKLLKVAQKANKHVPAYLLGQEPLPQDRPGYYSPGDEKIIESEISRILKETEAPKAAPAAGRNRNPA